MKTVSGRVPEEVADWVEDTTTKQGEPGPTKAKVLREALENSRAAQRGEKIILNPSSRELSRLEEYADREGLELDEAAEEVVRESLEDDGPATVGDLLDVVGRLPSTIRFSLVGILLSAIGVVLFFTIISLEYVLDTPSAQFLPSFVGALLVATTLVGVSVLFAGLFAEVARRILPVEAIERRLPGFRES